MNAPPATMQDAQRLGVVGLAERLRQQGGGAEAATRHFLDRIARFDPQIHAFTHVATEEALAAAQASDRRLAEGTARPLEGVPIALKANIDVAGWPVTGGIGAFRDRIAPRDAEVTRRLRGAGAVLLGLLNMHEAALGATTDNVFFGRTHNPHRLGVTPGGSSGGSGAAVAAGLCAAALGTDTLGSVRIPAGYCGVAGLKPTNGAVSNDGLMLLVEQWDCIGPLARSVADCGAVMEVLTELQDSPTIARVATLASMERADLAPAVRAAFRTARDLLRGLGLEVGEHAARLDPHRVRMAGFVTATREAQARFGDALRNNVSGFSQQFRDLLAFGARFDAAAIREAQATLEAAQAELHAILQAADTILLPTTPGTAFAFDGPHPVSQADFTALASIAGLPALSIPAGWTKDGLPVGIQLLARPGAERALIAVGSRLERALNASRWPQDVA
jgi:aspartyl-tRNA(Asn)/glutamyl-tRNA(Gln) amidotransferase subunit A